jgi:aminoglycoside phosphotransferase (APT) family kinase protein
MVGSGWDNAVFRLGDELCVRLPRRQASAGLVDHELRWLPALAPDHPLPIPVPVRRGRPGQGYPWTWSICRWIDGETALHHAPAGAEATATTLGRFVCVLHQPAPADARTNPCRGTPLAERAPLVEEHLARLALDTHIAVIRQIWDSALAEPPWAEAPCWLHGDLHPGNLVVSAGRLVGVVDFGDLTAGDPATDLAVAWMLFPPEVRPVFREAAGDIDDATWGRARGWALALAVSVLDHSTDDPRMARLGRRTLDAVLADAGARP